MTAATCDVDQIKTKFAQRYDIPAGKVKPSIVKEKLFNEPMSAHWLGNSEDMGDVKLKAGKKFWRAVDRILERLDNRDWYNQPTLEEVADTLNAYEGEDMWNDIIWRLLCIDRQRCANGDGMTIYFQTGSMVMYFEAEKTWRAIHIDE